MVVSGHFDGTLRFWDLRSARLANEVTGLHTQQITSVAVGLRTGENHEHVPYLSGLVSRYNGSPLRLAAAHESEVHGTNPDHASDMPCQLDADMPA